MLSDIHPGNFRVTPGKEVALLDRTFKLILSEQEVRLFTAFLNPLTPADRLAPDFVEYLVRDQTDEVKNKGDEWGSNVERLVLGIRQQNWEETRKALVDLKRIGVKIPLKFTLLMRNLDSFQGMAEKAGLKYLVSAYVYVPLQNG